MKLLSFVLIYILLLCSCSSTCPKNKPHQVWQKIEQMTQTGEIFNGTISSSLVQALHDYKDQKILPNGEIYGKKCKEIAIVGTSWMDIESNFLKSGATKINSQLHDLQGNTLKDDNNKTIPMWVYLFPDGCMIRVKPKGMPGSYRPRPHLIKAVLYPYNGSHKDFKKEAFKVDLQGRPLPKWIKDLSVPYKDVSMQQLFYKRWGDLVHFPIEVQIP